MTQMGTILFSNWDGNISINIEVIHQFIFKLSDQLENVTQDGQFFKLINCTGGGLKFGISYQP